MKISKISYAICALYGLQSPHFVHMSGRAYRLAGGPLNRRKGL